MPGDLDTDPADVDRFLAIAKSSVSS